MPQEARLSGIEPPQQPAAKQSAPARWVEDPVTGDALTEAEPVELGIELGVELGPEDQGDDIDIAVGKDGMRCEQCQSVMGRDDIFCGECGFVSRSIARAFGTDFTGETRQVDLTRPDAVLPVPERVTPPASVTPPAPAVTPPAPTGTPPARVIPDPPTANVPARRSFLPADDGDDAADLEATRIVSRVSGNRFVLQFSTGESFTVHGSGLIGRNPQPEPGEFFDHLIRVLDTGKSVSKTHLEFGQESGAFWFKDRFSGNGTIIREPDISARRAEPDRRYRVVRGTRIDIGEQFFVIS